jgi:steroid delta-isomerase-like uncharacterized protein
MSIEANKELARRFYEEIWNEGREEAIDRFIAAGAAGNDPDFGAGREAFRTQWRQWRAAFPDLCFAIDDLIAEGDKVLTRWTLTGTHTGDFMGIPATGRVIAVTGMSLDRIEHGMIVEGFDGWDALGLRRQLGILPDDQ